MAKRTNDTCAECLDRVIMSSGPGRTTSVGHGDLERWVHEAAQLHRTHATARPGERRAEAEVT